MSKLQFHISDLMNYNDVLSPEIKKFRKGEPITDHELRELLKHYMCLEKMLYAEGEKFYHAWKDASDQVKRLIEMQDARRHK